ncbi:hypothetical protein P4C99_10585 [Pontiellaceae bacterium B1224]|nr:hypothetical protein [Pontiellaceae bacterium B1224]
MNPLMQEILGATGLVVVFIAVIGLVEALSRKLNLEAETARKSVHLAGGLGCLLFPILISSWITVLCLAVVFAGIFYFGEKQNKLKSISSVERTSYGSLLFPVAILILFVVSNGRLWLYVSSLLVLVLADAAAALAGTRYGQTFFHTAPGERKSLEGSVMFFVVGFFSVYLPMCLLSDIPHTTCLLTALLMSLLLAGLEAVSIGGTDNLFVPLATCFLLLKLPTKPQVEIAFQCLSLIGITLGLYFTNKRHGTLRTRPLIIFILSSFAAWSLGAADWMIPIIVGFTIYNKVCTPCKRLPVNLPALVLLRPMYPPLFILFAANATLQFDYWFGPYVVATSATTSLCIASRYRRENHCEQLKGLRLWTAILLPITASLLLCLSIQGPVVWTAFPVAIPLCAIAVRVYMRFKHNSTESFPWSLAITFYSGATALIYTGFQHFGLVQPLEPSTWMEVFR